MKADLFRDLAHAAVRAWEGVDFDESAFPKLAAELLGEARLDRLGALGVLEHALQDRDVQLEHRSCVMLAHVPRVNIYAHLWHGALAVPHSHRWSGAYQIVAGENVTTYWEFDQEDVVNSFFQLGRARQVAWRVMKPGDVAEVPADEHAFHALGYYTTYGCAVSIRGRQRQQGLFEIYRPGVRYDLENELKLTGNQSTALGHVRRIDPARFAVLLDELGRSSDPETLFRVMQHFGSDDRTRIRVMSAARERHGRRADAIGHALEDMTRRAMLEGLIQDAQDDETRYCLCALYLSADRTRFFELLRERAPERVEELFADSLCRVMPQVPVERLRPALLALARGEPLEAAAANAADEHVRAAVRSVYRMSILEPLRPVP